MNNIQNVFSVLFIVIAFSFHCNSQSLSKSELKKELRELKSQAYTLEKQIKGINDRNREAREYIRTQTDDFTNAEVVSTKDRSGGLITPQYQMIASRIENGNSNLYRIGIEIYTQNSAVNSDKVYIKSDASVHEFDVTKDNFNVESATVDSSVNWGWGIKTGSETEVYQNTFFFTVPENEFFQIIASKDLKVRFSDIGVPDINIQNYDVENMNMLYYYLTSEDQLNMLSDQLNELKSRIYDIEGKIKSM